MPDSDEHTLRTGEQGRMETVGMSSSKWQGKLTLSYKYQLRVPVPKLLQIHPHSSD